MEVYGGVFALLSTHRTSWWKTVFSTSPTSPPGQIAPPALVGAKHKSLPTWTFLSGECATARDCKMVVPGTASQISGGTWLLRSMSPAMPQTWEMRSNGTTFTSGSLAWGGGTSASPKNFTTGSGGSGALTRTVLAGDIIELYVHKSGTSEDFVGTDITVAYVGWDSKTDWSDASNPNGQLSYGGRLSDWSFDLLSVHQSAWLPGDLGANQPAWADAAGAVPGWCKSMAQAPTISRPAESAARSAITRWTSNFSARWESAAGSGL